MSAISVTLTTTLTLIVAPRVPSSSSNQTRPEIRRTTEDMTAIDDDRTRQLRRQRNRLLVNLFSPPASGERRGNKIERLAPYATRNVLINSISVARPIPIHRYRAHDRPYSQLRRNSESP